MTKYKIHQVDAEILMRTEYQGGQFILQLLAKPIADIAKAGSFVHIQCDISLKLRRPISIMRANVDNGTIDLLFKIVGKGTELLSQKSAGTGLSILGPIGKPFTISENISKPLLIGGGVGMPPMIFLAETLHNNGINPLVILGSEVPFPFKIQPSTIMVDGINEIGTMSLLDNSNIACRLTSRQNYAGVHQGLVTDLAKKWLDSLSVDTLKQVGIYSCGPHPMLKAVHKLAQEYNLPCQVSLEEFMACGVGGCAACVVKVTDGDNISMQRVCVDGPVFEANLVF